METNEMMRSSGNSGNGLLANQSNDSVSDYPRQNFNNVITSINKILGLIHQIYLNASFNIAPQLVLSQRLNCLIIELQNLVQLSEKCKIPVPLEVLNLIDNGKNPDQFTQDFLNNCIAKNQIIRGQINSFKLLRKSLLEELDLNFPEVAETYREIRTLSAFESKRLDLAQLS